MVAQQAPDPRTLPWPMPSLPLRVVEVQERSVASTGAGAERHQPAGSHWITVHPDGPDSKGHPALIGANGAVLGGMGGKFNGVHIADVAGGRHPGYGHAEIKHAEFNGHMASYVGVAKHIADVSVKGTPVQHPNGTFSAHIVGGKHLEKTIHERGMTVTRGNGTLYKHPDGGVIYHGHTDAPQDWHGFAHHMATDVLSHVMEHEHDKRMSSAAPEDAEYQQEAHQEAQATHREGMKQVRDYIRAEGGIKAGRKATEGQQRRGKTQRSGDEYNRLPAWSKNNVSGRLTLDQMAGVVHKQFPHLGVEDEDAFREYLMAHERERKRDEAGRQAGRAERAPRRQAAAPSQDQAAPSTPVHAATQAAAADKQGTLRHMAGIVARHMDLAPDEALRRVTKNPSGWAQKLGEWEAADKQEKAVARQDAYAPTEAMGRLLQSLHGRSMGGRAETATASYMPDSDPLHGPSKATMQALLDRGMVRRVALPSGRVEYSITAKGRSHVTPLQESAPVLSLREAGGAGHWITLHAPGDEESGTVHVFIGGGGRITKGPSSLIGAHIGHIASHHAGQGGKVTHHPEGHVPAGHSAHPSYTEHQAKVHVFGKKGPGVGYDVDNPLPKRSKEEAIAGLQKAQDEAKGATPKAEAKAEPEKPAEPKAKPKAAPAKPSAAAPPARYSGSADNHANVAHFEREVAHHQEQIAFHQEKRKQYGAGGGTVPDWVGSQLVRHKEGLARAQKNLAIEKANLAAAGVKPAAARPEPPATPPPAPSPAVPAFDKEAAAARAAQRKAEVEQQITHHATEAAKLRKEAGSRLGTGPWREHYDQYDSLLQKYEGRYGADAADALKKSIPDPHTGAGVGDKEPEKPAEAPKATPPPRGKATVRLTADVEREKSLLSDAARIRQSQALSAAGHKQRIDKQMATIKAADPYESDVKGWARHGPENAQRLAHLNTANHYAKMADAMEERMNEHFHNGAGKKAKDLMAQLEQQQGRSGPGAFYDKAQEHINALSDEVSHAAAHYGAAIKELRDTAQAHRAAHDAIQVPVAPAAKPSKPAPVATAAKAPEQPAPAADTDYARSRADSDAGKANPFNGPLQHGAGGFAPGHMANSPDGRDALVRAADHAMAQNMAKTSSEQLALHSIRTWLPQMGAWTGPSRQEKVDAVHAWIDKAKGALARAHADLNPDAGKKEGERQAAKVALSDEEQSHKSPASTPTPPAAPAKQRPTWDTIQRGEESDYGGGHLRFDRSSWQTFAVDHPASIAEYNRLHGEGKATTPYDPTLYHVVQPLTGIPGSEHPFLPPTLRPKNAVASMSKYIKRAAYSPDQQAAISHLNAQKQKNASHYAQAPALFPEALPPPKPAPPEKVKKPSGGGAGGLFGGLSEAARILARRPVWTP